MAINKIENHGNVNDLIENSNWEIDRGAEHPVFRTVFEIELVLQNQNAFRHHFNETFYAVSCVRNSTYDNKLYVEKFEVNKPFRKQGIGKFAFYELLKYHHPMIASVELFSISPESDGFFEYMKMQREGSHKFVGDATWLSNFIKSMTTEDNNDIIKKIELIRNRLCD